MQQTNLLGLAYAFAAFLAWGFLPLYWKLLQEVPAGVILAHRIIWSFIFVVGILGYQRRTKMLREVLANKKQVLLITVCGLFIGSNWFIYIWAVNANHLIEASLGYYINPLLVVLLGVVVLGERLNQLQTLAVLVAAFGVAVVTYEYGQVPWIALSLASTFAIYGLFKKLVPVDAATGLAIETAVLVPLAVVYLGFQHWQGNLDAVNFNLKHIFLLLGTGVVTALPLLWFAKGSKLISLSTMGFTQYIAPSISLFIGVVVFREPFSQTNLISFGLIWVALALYSLASSSLAAKLQSSVERKGAY